MSPTTQKQNYASLILLLAFGGVFGVIAVAPFIPHFSSLTKEQAHVQKVWKENFSTTTTQLRTISGHNVKCVHTKFGGCDSATMKTLLEQEKPVVVWHDGRNVYQLSAEDRMILPYEHAHRGRWFAGVLSIIAFVASGIQTAIRNGFVGVATIRDSEP